ncbi:MAG: virulence RhuM family protein, partial [Kiritimatiellae bacterium]|nr:virulence RhuM family protein [Kiritimatiellia bacterium]
MRANENQIVVYQPNETVRLDVRLENETVWLNRHQMSQLFGRDIKTIGKHIANALFEELACVPVVAKFATTAADGKVYQVEYYNLDVILSVGYRVKSAQGILFRRWANAVLKEYLLRGYSVNTRLSQLEDKVDRRLAKHDERIATLEQKVDFFVQTQTPPLQGVFYDGQLWDARAL